MKRKQLYLRFCWRIPLQQSGGGRGTPLPTSEPEWGVYRDGTDGQKAYIYGAEYQTNTLSGYMRSFHDHDVPCAVCLVPKKSIVKMFPGKKVKFYHFINQLDSYK